MIVLVLLAIGCPAIVPAVTAQSGSAKPAAPRRSSWRQIVTPDFVVVGDASTSDLKRTLTELTRFRNTLTQLFPNAVTASAVPTYVVVFGNYEAFQRFVPRDSRGKRQQNVGGYFSRTADANLIVLPVSFQSGDMQTVFHEYTHAFIARNVHTPVPTWLNEGLADFFSTFRGDFRGKTLVGAPSASRVAALKSYPFVPLRDIVSPSDLESRWRSGRQIGMFYAESWALVHLIMAGRPASSSSPINVYLTTLARTSDQDAAFRAAFGTDVDGMDRELRSYIQRFLLNGLLYDIQADTHAVNDARPISEADRNALEGRLLLEMRDFEGAERELTQALREQPTHAGASIALARLCLEQDREDEAIATLQNIAATDNADASAQYHLGEALSRAWRHDEALVAFSKAVRQEPRNPFYWVGLANSATARRRDTQARGALQTALQTEWSPSYYWQQAIDALRVGRDDVVITSLATYMDLAGIDEEKSVYPLFLRAIAAWRSGRPSDAETALALAEKAEVPKEWTRTVLRYLQNRMDEQQFLRAAHDPGEQTEAHTYIGFKYSVTGHSEEALTHFRWVAEHGSRNYTEYQLAKDELNRLKYRQSASPVQ